MSKGGLKNNVLLSELSSFCQKHPRTEKILIAPGYQTGHQILESLTRCGTSKEQRGKEQRVKPSFINYQNPFMFSVYIARVFSISSKELLLPQVF